MAAHRDGVTVPAFVQSWLCRINDIVATIQGRRTTTIDQDSMILGFFRNESWKMLPVGNISIADVGPVWGDGCVSCFACLHWCPQRATHLSSHDLQIDHAYHHPDVSLPDMTESAG